MREMKHGIRPNVQAVFRASFAETKRWLDICVGLQKLASVMAQAPTEFCGVTAVTKANIYFDGKVVSHTLLFPDGSKKTLGLIYPGTYHFGTDKAERMEIVAGHCEVRLDGQSASRHYHDGQSFEVPAKSGFDIEATLGICEYVCSFLP